MSLRVVFDTNVLVGAILSMGGKPFRCLNLARIGLIKSVTCEEILKEFQNVLIRTFDYPAKQALLAFEEVRKFSEIIKITGMLKIINKHPEIVFSY